MRAVLARPAPATAINNGRHGAPCVKVSLFLGAGASVAYGMPTTRDFKDRMAAKCGADPEWAGALAGGEDIEEVLTTVKEVARLPGTRGGIYLERRHPQIRKSAESMGRLEDLIKHEIHEAYTWNPLHNEALGSVLGAWLGLIRECGHDIVVFTTNYDRSVEEYCSLPGSQLGYTDGFEPDSTGDYMRWAGMRGNNAWSMSGAGMPLHRLHLLKLHGSLGWKRHATHGPVRVNYEKKSSDPNQQDLLIYPSLSPKDEEEDEPYATIFKHFRKQLMSSDACIVVGFSFRDERIRDEFVQFVGQGKRLVVVSPTGEEDVVRHMPGSEPYQDPHSRLGTAPHVRTVRAPPPAGAGQGGSPAEGLLGQGPYAYARDGGMSRSDGILSPDLILGARYGRANNTIYVVQRPVDTDSISEIAGLVRGVLLGGAGYA